MRENLLYITINLAVLSIPLLLSFDKKVAFYKQWKYLFPSIAVVGLLFIVWDIWFATSGYWGFNERYHSAIKIFNLPLGEILFFVTVPYACVFIYASLAAYLKKYIDQFPSTYFLILFFIGGLTLLLPNYDKIYTIMAIPLSWLIVLWLIFARPKYMNVLIVAYIVSLIPFLFVNGILTGSFIEEEIVWYSEKAFSNNRIFTIPLEDLFYSFDLMALTIILMEQFKVRSPSPSNF